MLMVIFEKNAFFEKKFPGGVKIPVFELFLRVGPSLEGAAEDDFFTGSPL